MDISKIAYQKYQLDWMIQHGNSLNDLVTELQVMIDEADEDENINLKSLFDDWEYGYGFSQEIWVCYDEFIGVEFLDYEYMGNLLTPNEYVRYLEYLRENDIE